MSEKLKAYIQIHLAVILYGLTAILGDLIEMSAVMLVWWRVFISSISLLLFVKFGKAILKLPLRTNLIFIGIGFVVAIHWVCFYGAIKLSNASVALVAMSTTTLFTSIVEPFIFKRSLNRFDIFFALAIVPGMAMVVSNLHLSMINGFLVGLLSAFLASLFSILTKKNMSLASPFEISFLEIFGALIAVSIFLPYYLNTGVDIKIVPSANDWIYLGILSLLCTTFAYYLGVVALRHLSAYESNLVVNLEPVYGILLAIVILKEHKEMSDNFYIGVVLILILVLSYPFIRKKTGR